MARRRQRLPVQRFQPVRPGALDVTGGDLPLQRAEFMAMTRR